MTNDSTVSDAMQKVRRGGFRLKEIQWAAKHNFQESVTTEAIMGKVFTPEGLLVEVFVPVHNETYEQTRERILKVAEAQYG